MRTATALAAGVVATGAVLASAGPASASTPHTLTLISVFQSGVDHGNTSVTVDKDFSHGQRIGTDSVNCVFNFHAGQANCVAVLSLANGSLTLRLNPIRQRTSTITGSIALATGVYRGAHGTVTAHNLNPQGTRTYVVINYTR